MLIQVFSFAPSLTNSSIDLPNEQIPIVVTTYEIVLRDVSSKKGMFSWFVLSSLDMLYLHFLLVHSRVYGYPLFPY